MRASCFDPGGSTSFSGSASASYRFLREPGLDPHRLALYRLALHLSLVVEPAHGSSTAIPRPRADAAIVAYNTRQACLDIGVTGA
jgi:hypothetical protein